LNHTSILRWSGSKAKLLHHLVDRAPPSYRRYVEPFAGSACLFFNLRPNTALLGDINREVIAVYRAIQSAPHRIATLLESIPHTRDAYSSLRATHPSTLSDEERAARLIFLMKACFNGVYRTNRKGEFNVPMGNRVYALPSLPALLEAQRLLTNTTLIAGDFSQTLAATEAGDWVYLDPPYQSSKRYRGEFGYGARFQGDAVDRLVLDMRRMADAGRHVMLSHSFDEDLKSRLTGWYVHEVQTLRTVSGKGARRAVARELIATSYPT